ncbi:DNA primase [Curvibacter sp. HBC61]|uniref:DNA primase n=1 Tax=Curvibacter cyanobacteriorum TaxID=3026422 RepID=A0ABT5MXK5_9BURK|nr:DNA primase [Curvibacter sp. HBC61]MDD0838640.1 DNA primase [Curvibacter sp. HBC61]
MTIPQSFIQELLARADVVEIVGRYVPLKKAGANFMGLCPFHGEKSPSFSVSPTKQFYHCFGCGKNGNAIGFLMDHGGMSFLEAVDDLAQQYGLQVPQDDLSPQEKARAAEQRQRQLSLSDVLEKAGDAYRKHLRASPKAVAYLKGRGLSGEIAKRFGLGYAPEGWRSLASVFPEYDSPLLAECGLVIVNDEDAKRYDRFRDRIMFPIRNVKGECIGFGGRVLGDEKPKYLNSPETPVFSKGRELYGLFEARTALREQGYALVTEGYMDVVALAQLGFPNAVATLGTACTTDHVHKLFRFTDAVVFSFDGDAAGRRAARKALDGALPYATDTRSVKFLFLPAEHDPDSFIREHGADAFSRHVAEALPLSRFLIEAAREQCDLGTAEGRARMAANARPLWSALPEGVLKRQLLGELAELAQLPAADLAALWQQAGGTAAGRSGSRGAPEPDDAPDWHGGHSQGAPGGGWHDGGAQAGGGPRGQGAAGGPGGGFKRFDKGAFKGPFKGGQGPGGFKGPGGDRDGWRGGKWGQKPEENDDGPRTPPVTRADHAARLLLSHMGALDHLTHEDHQMLCELPPPHGPLFVWLESQYHEHGAVAWAVLRESLRQQPFDALATRLMTGSHAQTEGEIKELRAELRGVLNRMLVDRLKQLENEAIVAVRSDPSALERYRHLFKRRTELELSLQRVSIQ